MKGTWGLFVGDNKQNKVFGDIFFPLDSKLDFMKCIDNAFAISSCEFFRKLIKILAWKIISSLIFSRKTKDIAIDKISHRTLTCGAL